MRRDTKFMLRLTLILFCFSSQIIYAAGVVPQKHKVESILASMTLREKVGQLFIVDLARLNGLQPVTVITPEISDKLAGFHFGGIILFAHNLEDSPQIKTLIKDLHRTEKLPLFICIDEEGGRVSRLEHTESLRLQKVPSAETIGQRDDPEYTYKQGETLGAQLNEFGFNVDFAPVVDINTNPDNTVIGARSFGSTPELVSRMGEEIIRGLQDNGIMACAKHFPGHGDTSIDTHNALAVINHPLTRLRNEEFIPFKAAIDSGVMSIMLAHIVTPEITGTSLPATMSESIVNDILRRELNFNGLIITDALMMKAITENYTASEVCTRAIDAGVDILLMPDNIEEGFNAVLDQAQRDPDFAGKVEESVKRIITAKLRLNLIAE